MEYLKKLEADHYIPGHGEVCAVEYLDEQASVVEDWIEAILEAVEKGWSLEETQNTVSFLHRHPMAEGMEDFGPELQKINVARLYTLTWIST